MNVALALVPSASLPFAVTVTVYIPAVVPGVVVVVGGGLLTGLLGAPAPPHPDRNKPPVTTRRITNATMERNVLLDFDEKSESNPASTKPPAPPHGVTGKAWDFVVVAALVDTVTVVVTLLASEPKVTAEPGEQVGRFCAPRGLDVTEQDSAIAPL